MDKQSTTEGRVYETLQQLGISYEKHEHPAVFTTTEAELHDIGETTRCKNLFLRNAKGDKHYLVIMEANKPLDLKRLSSNLGERLSFASPERLQEYLRLTPGSVSPFGLINNTSHNVIAVIDDDLIKHTKVSFHPNINTATLVLDTNDFKKYLEWTGNSIRYMGL